MKQPEGEIFASLIKTHWKCRVSKTDVMREGSSTLEATSTSQSTPFAKQNCSADLTRVNLTAEPREHAHSVVRQRNLPCSVSSVLEPLELAGAVSQAGLDLLL